MPGADLADEIRNFREITQVLKPASGDLPVLKGIDFAGFSLPLTAVGGDHVIYLDFNRRFDMPKRIEAARAKGDTALADRLQASTHRAGVLLADVSGHRETDALVAAMLHQAFLLGVYYELDLFGEITTKLFEHLNQRLYKTTHIHKYVTMVYGEVSERGRFRFITAGHPLPLVFSREFGRFAEIKRTHFISFPPVGMFPTDADLNERVNPGALGYKKRYSMNEIALLSPGDILLLYTDGLSDHAEGIYLDERLEGLLASLGGHSAAEIAAAIKEDVLAAGAPVDDVSLIVLKRVRVAH